MGTIITVWNWYRNYFAAGGYGVLFVIALCWLWQQHRKALHRDSQPEEQGSMYQRSLQEEQGSMYQRSLPEEQGSMYQRSQPEEQGAYGSASLERERCFLWPVMILLAVIFCPVSAWAIMRAIGADVYWRVFWMLPVVPVLAWVLTRLVRSIPRKWHRLLAVLGCAAVLALNGTWVFSETFFKARENNYKLPARIIETADAIDEHADAHNEMKRVVAQMDISVLIRLYKPGFTTYYGRRMLQKPKTQTKLYRQVNAAQPDPEKLVSLSEKYHYRYIVLRQDQDDRSGMLAQGLEVIMDKDGYVVYYDPHFANLKQE